jgi:peptidyl-prolyl cis-trans isomerase C
MGGDLGYFTRGQMVEPFENAAFALGDSGEVTDELVRTQYGYHIIKLTGRETGALMDAAEAREMLVQTRRRRAVEEGVMQLRKTVTVRINPTVVDADLNDDT